MALLREEPVDISRYLPRFLRKDLSMAGLLDACSKEHERQRLTLLDVLDQFFVATATWGLSTWERVLAIRPQATDTVEMRRNQILLKLQFRQTSTVDFLERLCRRYMSADSAFHIEEENTRYVFHLHHSAGDILDFSGMLDALETYKPAHLGYDIALLRRSGSTPSIYIGAAVSIHRGYTVAMRVLKNAAASPARYIAAVPTSHRAFTVYERHADNAAIDAQRHMAACVCLDKVYCIEERSR